MWQCNGDGYVRADSVLCAACGLGSGKHRATYAHAYLRSSRRRRSRSRPSCRSLCRTAHMSFLLLEFVCLFLLCVSTFNYILPGAVRNGNDERPTDDDRRRRPCSSCAHGPQKPHGGKYASTHGKQTHTRTHTQSDCMAAAMKIDYTWKTHNQHEAPAIRCPYTICEIRIERPQTVAVT